MNIGILTMEKFERRKVGSVGSSRIRGDWIIKYLKEAEEFLIGKNYDAVIYQKAYYKDHMKAYNGIKIFDLCDPDWLDSRPIVEVASMVDAFTVSTDALREALIKFVDIPVYVIPDRMDLDFYSNPKKEHTGKSKSCVYFGYSGNAQVVLPQAIETLKYFDLELTVISDSPLIESGFYKSKFVKYDNETVNSEIIKHDFVLLPDAPTSNYKFSFKSNNKTVSARLLNMPVAKNAEDIERLMSAEERQKEVAKYGESTRKAYDVQLSAIDYLDLIKSLHSSKKA